MTSGQVSQPPISEFSGSAPEFQPKMIPWKAWIVHDAEPWATHLSSGCFSKKSICEEKFMQFNASSG